MAAAATAGRVVDFDGIRLSVCVATAPLSSESMAMGVEAAAAAEEAAAAASGVAGKVAAAGGMVGAAVGGRRAGEGTVRKMEEAGVDGWKVATDRTAGVVGGGCCCERGRECQPHTRLVSSVTGSCVLVLAAGRSLGRLWALG